jgi:hypothetical protein
VRTANRMERYANQVAQSGQRSPDIADSVMVSMMSKPFRATVAAPGQPSQALGTRLEFSDSWPSLLPSRVDLAAPTSVVHAVDPGLRHVR